MSRSRTWLIYLHGPPFPDSSAGRAQRLAPVLDARLLGLGLGLHRLRFLDRLFPVCLAGLRLRRACTPPEEACQVLQPGDRLQFGRSDSDR